MTIQGLAAFLKAKCPKAFERFDDMRMLMARFAGKTVVCDLAGYMHKYAYTHQDARTGTTNWPQVHESLLQMYTTFRDFEVTLVFIFDGTYAAQAKRGEHISRGKQRAVLKNKATQHNRAVEADLAAAAADAVAAESAVKRRRVDDGDVKPAEAEASSSVSSSVSDGLTLDERIAKMSDDLSANGYSIVPPAAVKTSTFIKHPVTINSAQYRDAQRFFLKNRVPFYNAVGEGEHLGALLVRSTMPQFSHIVALMSDDLDSIACGALLTIRFWRSGKQPLELIHLDRVLSTLRITYSQLVDMCVLCGSDFSSKLPGVGPAAALKLVQIWQSLDRIAVQPTLALQGFKHPTTHETAASAWPQFDFKTARALLHGGDFDARSTVATIDPREWIKPTSAFALIEFFLVEAREQYANVE